jgi:hypothetical protein
MKPDSLQRELHCRPQCAVILGLAVLGFTLPAAVPTARSAETPEPESRDESPAGVWRFETVKRKDGTVHQGLIQAEGRDEIELVEILRPPGRPMFAVVRPVATDDIAAIQRLDEPQRKQLLERIAGFRLRARIEAGRMQDVDLRQETVDHSLRWVYDGDWFRLESTADEEMTRRSVVRIEQIFRAYRQILPPRVEPSSRLRIELLGAMEDYRRRLHESGFQIVNPAFFSSAENRIVAGSDLNAYTERLSRTRMHHAEVRRQYRLLQETFPANLAAVLDQLRRNGFSDAEIELESRLRRAAWQREHDAALAKIAVVERQNQARFAEVTQQMFARLYHEAFHAYVENYVYSDPRHPLPRWLNEGLAQIFETAQLDGDTLRIDVPDVARLRPLQRDLAAPQPPRLVEMLDAPDDRFLDSHRGDIAGQLYLVAWGVAYYLTYEQNLLGGQRLDEYVANPENFGAIARFTRLIDMPLPKFEAAWRNAMLDLKPAAAP